MGHELELRRRLELGRKVSMDELVGALDRAVRKCGGSLEKNERITMEERIYGADSISAKVLQERVVSPLVRLYFFDFFAKAEFDAPPRRSQHICLRFYEQEEEYGNRRNLYGNRQYETVFIDVRIEMKKMSPTPWQWIYGLGIPIVGWIMLPEILSLSHFKLNLFISELPDDTKVKVECIMGSYLKAVIQELDRSSLSSETISA